MRVSAIHFLAEVERIQGFGTQASDPEGKVRAIRSVDGSPEWEWYPKPGRPLPRGVFIPKSTMVVHPDINLYRDE